MREVKLGTILENAARLAGRQVGVMGVPESWRALAGLSFGEGVRRIAGEKFPMMTRVEYRRYRPTWSSNVGWARGMECWYGGWYWRLEGDASTGAPGVAACWKQLGAGDVVAFVAWDQPWEPVEMDRGAVDCTRFAYEHDPKYNPTTAPLKVAAVTEMGVVLQAPAPNGVFCKFTPKYPRVSFVAWDKNRAYGAGECAYVAADGEVYEAMINIAAVPGATGNPEPSADTERWQVVRISAEFENYLTRLIAADFLTEDQGKYQTKAAAEKEFEVLCERYHEGVGATRVRTGRFC